MTDSRKPLLRVAPVVIRQERSQFGYANSSVWMLMLLSVENVYTSAGAPSLLWDFQ